MIDINKIDNQTLHRMLYYLGLAEVRKYASQLNEQNDIKKHLKTLYNLVYETKPRVILEFGVRLGNSTFALSKGAALCNSILISVDRELGCADANDSDRWIFIHGDDIQFVKGLTTGGLDFIFVDSDHDYKHVVELIGVCKQKASSRCVWAFHDGNSQYAVDVRNAITELFNLPEFDWETDYKLKGEQYELIHHAYNNGLTIIKQFGDLK